jgi:dolichol-phosphate mannosyltransferase
VEISVVIPVHNEEEALPAFHRALAEALDRLPQSAEIIFADDESRDGSAATLDGFAEGDPRVRVLHLSRNYGQTAALTAGNPEQHRRRDHPDGWRRPERSGRYPASARQTRRGL